MISYVEALKILEHAAGQRGTLPEEGVPLAEACGRIAARRIRSAEPLPPFTNSSMDGYAVVASQTAGASRSRPLRLSVAGSSSAGDRPPRPRRAEGAFEIMTGAPVPAGYDAVVKVEEVAVLEGGRAIELTSPAVCGDFIRRAGQDFAPGTPVIDPGERLDPRHLLALAALGVDRVPVRHRPKVALISTGRELVPPGERPGPGRIRNSTATYLLSALPLAGAEVRFHGTVADDPVDFQKKVKAVLEDRPDILLTTGAVSMGRHDFVTSSFKEMGAELLFHRVAIRPGKPLLAARFKGGPLVLGLPGNPVSTVVGLRFFLIPVLFRLLGQAQERPVTMKLAAETPKPEGLRCFFKARASASPDGARVRVLSGQASFQVRPLLEANAWAILTEEGERVPKGAEVEVLPLFPGPDPLDPAPALGSREGDATPGRLTSTRCC